MNKYITSLLCACCLVVLSTSCQQVLIPDDVSGISLKSVDVFVEYTAAKVFGDINVKNNPDRISEVRVYYGTASDALDRKVKATYDTQNGYSADLTDLEDGVQYFYRVDIIVGRTPVEGIVNDFVTFPMGPVDLDLPSNKKWASHNVGARIPTETGDYYAWGEMATKNRYDWTTYQLANGDYYHLTKYITDKSYSYDKVTVDNHVELLPDDDVASKLLGTGYSIPSYGDWQELMEYCNISYSIRINGVECVKVSSKKNPNNNHKSIYLTAACGYYDGTAIFDRGHAYYWSSTLASTSPHYARSVKVWSIGLANDSGSRCLGEQVRAIFK